MRSALRMCILAFLATLASAPSWCQTRDFDARFHLAQGFERGGDFERAAALYEELLAREPSNVVVFDALQRMLVQLKKYDRLVPLLRARLSRSPADISLLGQLGTALYRMGKESEADTVWERILGTGSSSPQVYRHLASVLIENRLLDRASEVYLRGRASCNDSSLFTAERAQLLGVMMEYRGAAEEYLRWLEYNPAQVAYVQGRLSTFGWNPGDRAAVIALVQARAEHTGALPLQELLGWLYMEAKEYDRALENARTRDQSSRAQGSVLFAFAERAFRDRYFEVAARAFREAIDVLPSAAKVPSAQYGIARCLQELELRSDSAAGSGAGGQGVFSSADVLSAFRRVIADHPHSEFAARAYYQIGVVESDRRFNLDAALAAFREALVVVGSTPLLRHDIELRLGRVFVARGDTAQATLEYLRVAGAPDAGSNQADEATFRLAELDFFCGRPRDALGRLDALSLNTGADVANDAIGLQSFLQENERTAPEALTRFGTAALLERQRRTGEAIALFRTIVRQYPGSLLLDDALLHIGALQETAGLFADAVRTYEQLLTDYRETSGVLDQAHFRLGELYQRRLHDAARALGAYEALLAQTPGSMLAAEARRRIRLLRGEPS